MSKKLLDNPFPVTTYHGAEYFCNREEETNRLVSNIKNGNSTTLISIRRVGKTGLIHHVLSQLPQNCKGIYIDILETESLNQFLNLFTSSIINSIPEKSSIGKTFFNYIKSLRPVINYDSLTGSTQASFDLKPAEVQSSIHSIFQFLEKQDSRIVIAIDEFQQILHYPEKNIDAWFRSRIQQMKNVVFIFSGSHQHMMNELFSSPKRPFYRSTQILKLEKLSLEDYAPFIISMFKKFNKSINKEIASEILQWTNCHTFYVQQLCNRVFSATQKTTTTELWKQQAHSLIKEQESVFFALRNMLTNPQWQLLKAIAHEETVFQPTSKTFLEKYRLGTSATVLRSLKTLQEYELIFVEYDENGLQYYSVYDIYFKHWVKSR
jgi:uncharacterized protein